jgi:hypothetical protein
LEHKVSKELIVLKIIESESETEFKSVCQDFTKRLNLKHNNIV